jgi:hypothetical protein
MYQYNPSNNFYPQTNNIDLREEFSAVLRGRIDLIPQGRYVNYRKLSDTPCICFDTLTGSGVDGCPYCSGEGFPWYLTQELFYIARGVAPIYKPGFLATGQYPQTSYGYTDPNRATAYCEYTVYPDYERYINGTKKNFDKLYELKVGNDGGLFYPVTQTDKWKIMALTPLHGDNGRIEFFEIALEKEDF